MSGRLPVLEPMSRTRLRETDSVTIGMPVGVAVSPNGDIYISEGFGTRILQFDSTGALRNVLGRYGYGPNEFVEPAFLTMADDTTLLITDLVRRDITLWNLAQEKARLRIPYHGMPGYFVVSAGTITGTVYDVVRGTVAMRWHMPALTSEPLGKLPPVFMHNNYFAIYGQIPMDVFGDSAAYLAGDIDYVRITDSTWTVVDSIFVPRRTRRGIPSEIDSTMGHGRNIYDVMNQLSNPYAFHRLSGGRYAIIHVDGIFKNSGVTGSLFLTVVTKESEARCVDLPLPVHDDNALARLTFVGDTLFVLDHFVEGMTAKADIIKIVLSQQLC